MTASDRASKWLLQATVTVTFVLSYAGLQRFAVSSDQSIPWLWPAALDVPALGVAVVVWRAQELGHPSRVARLFVAGLVALSTGLQVSTVPGEILVTMPARVGHGLPPLVLYGMWETVLWAHRLSRQVDIAADQPKDTSKVHVRRPDTPRTSTQPERIVPAVSDVQQSPDIPEVVPVTADTSGRRWKLPEVEAVVADMKAEGLDVNDKTLAPRLELTDRQARRWLARMGQWQALEPDDRFGVASSNGGHQ